jgi:protease I
MEKEGFKVDIISLHPGKIKAWNNGNWSNEYKVDNTLDKVKAKNYDALVLPGGVINPDKLRRSEEVLNFVKDFFDENKLVAAICHGPWTLISADVIKGKTLTSFFSIRKDIENAGARWVDKKVVVDGSLITSRNPDDLPAFNEKLIEEINNRKSLYNQA